MVAHHHRSSLREGVATAKVNGRALLQADSLARVEERIDAETTARRAYAHMAHISPGDRAVLELVALDGLSVTDAARVLDLTPVAARVRLHRARRSLRAAMTPSSTSTHTTATEATS